MADDKKQTTTEKFVAKRTAKIGSKKNGSPKIDVTRGQDLGTLSKDDQETYKKYKIID